MERKEIGLKCDEILKELEVEHKKFLDFYCKLKTEHFKNRMLRPLNNFKDAFDNHIELLKKIKDDKFELRCCDYEELEELFGVKDGGVENGIDLIKHLSPDDLLLFMFGILFSFRGDWSETGSRAEAFRIASEELLKKNKFNESVINSMMSMVESFDNEYGEYKDGRDFRCMAPSGYYGAFKFIGIPKENRVFSGELNRALRFYCRYFDEKGYFEALAYEDTDMY